MCALLHVCERERQDINTLTSVLSVRSPRCVHVYIVNTVLCEFLVEKRRQVILLLGLVYMHLRGVTELQTYLAMNGNGGGAPLCTEADMALIDKLHSQCNAGNAANAGKGGKGGCCGGGEEEESQPISLVPVFMSRFSQVKWSSGQVVKWSSGQVV